MMLLKLLFVLASSCSGSKTLMNIEGKIALVTGGAQGIGYATIEALLRARIRGVTLVDLNAAKGRTAARSLNSRYGHGKVISLPADVSNESQLEDAFKISLQHWKGLDIVVNNAGIANEKDWMLTINTNSVGTLHGTFLGFRYMSKSTGGKGGVIVNLSSLSALGTEYYFLPVYSASKSVVLGLGRALGHQAYYDYNGVRIVTVCPGLTPTALVHNLETLISNSLAPNLSDIAVRAVKSTPFQLLQSVGGGIRKVIEDGSNGSVWVIEDDELPYEIDFPERKTMRKKNA